MPRDAGGSGSAHRPDEAFLSDLAEEAVSVELGPVRQGHGIGFWQSENDGERHSGAARLSVDTHPPQNGSSQVAYELPEGKYSIFQAGVALNDSRERIRKKYRVQPLIFRVVGDGKELWQVARHNRCRAMPSHARGGHPAACGKLELFVDCQGPNSFGHAIWVDPQVKG